MQSHYLVTSCVGEDADVEDGLIVVHTLLVELHLAHFFVRMYVEWLLTRVVKSGKRRYRENEKDKINNEPKAK
jgi:hypothetical protein